MGATAKEAVKCDGCRNGEGFALQFDFAFQPIVDVFERRTFAQEALIRGPAGEGAFTVLGQVTEANRYSFDQACRRRAIATAAEVGISELLSINFLPNAVYRPEVCIRTTFEAAREFNFPTSAIMFEATEGERVEDGHWLTEVFSEYQRLGFKTAIDDFGAGYSGLNLFARFQPDYIKLDMDLVRDIHLRRPSQAIVRGVLRTCEELGVQVIAEGVEHAEERDFLIDAGVRYLQGYWFAKPSFRAIAAVPDTAWPNDDRPPHPRRRKGERASLVQTRLRLAQ